MYLSYVHKAENDRSHVAELIGSVLGCTQPEIDMALITIL